MRLKKNTFEQEDICAFVILAGLVIILVLLLIPLLIISQFGFVQGDDIAFLEMSGKVWYETHSLIKTVIYEIGKSAALWRDWQGLYFMDWLYFVCMAIFGVKLFGITTYISVFSIIISDCLFSWFVLHKLFDVKLPYALIFFIPICIFQLSIPATGAEAFYWMVGAINYTVAFSIAVIFLAVLLYEFFRSDDKNSIIHIIFLFILSFVLGGSTYVVGVPVLSTILVLLILEFISKKKRWFFFVLFGWFLLCFLLNALSPGNSVRLNSEGTGNSAFYSIIISFWESFKFLLGRFNLPFILLNVFLLPLYYVSSRKTEFRFKWPILVSVISFCVYASMFTPNLFGLGTIGVYRIQNLYRFVCFLLVPVNIWYWTGFVLRVIDNRKDGKKTNDRANKSINKKIVFFSILKIFYAAFASAIILFSLYKTYGRTMTSVSAYYSLRSGEAETFYNEWQERLAVLEDETITDPVFEPFSQKPYLLYMADLSEDSNHYVNRSLAEYYNKNSVRLKGE